MSRKSKVELTGRSDLFLVTEAREEAGSVRVDSSSPFDVRQLNTPLGASDALQSIILQPSLRHQRGQDRYDALTGACESPQLL